MTETRKEYAVDFETYYDDDFSLRKMPTWSYVFDEQKFDAYLVAVVGEDLKWVGDPKDFDWELLRDSRVIMHNASFDYLVMLRLARDGMIPEGINESLDVVDTADMAAFMRTARNLADACKYLMGVTLSKEVRARMKGVTASEAKDKGWWTDVCNYGISDSIYTYKLWVACNKAWPKEERDISRLNREAGIQGFPVNINYIKTCCTDLAQTLFDAKAKIPWVHEKGLTPLSRKGVAEQGREEGLEVPSSLAAKDPDYLAWVDQYGHLYPWIHAMSEWRRINALLKRFETLRDSIRDDGSIMLQIKYHGAATGRFSGGGSGRTFNPQNMPRGDMFGANLRSCFIAKPGHKLIIADFAQIEARMLLWTVKDKAMLKTLAKEGNLYQAYAKAHGLFSGGTLKKEDPDLYNYIKAVVLSLGYGCGPVKFYAMACGIFGLTLTEEEAKVAVATYRAANPAIVAFWKRHQVALRKSTVLNDGTHEVELPSGRTLTYFTPHYETIAYEVIDEEGNPQRKMKRELVSNPVRGTYENQRRVYGGLVVENYIQAIARDVLRDAWIKVMSPEVVAQFDWYVCLNVHDELVMQVPEDKVDAAVAALPELMCASKDTWAKGCPLDIDVMVTEEYCK